MKATKNESSFQKTVPFVVEEASELPSDLHRALMDSLRLQYFIKGGDGKGKKGTFQTQVFDTEANMCELLALHADTIKSWLVPEEKSHEVFMEKIASRVLSLDSN